MHATEMTWVCSPGTVRWRSVETAVGIGWNARAQIVDNFGNIPGSGIIVKTARCWGTVLSSGVVLSQMDYIHSIYIYHKTHYPESCIFYLLGGWCPVYIDYCITRMLATPRGRSREAYASLQSLNG